MGFFKRKKKEQKICPNCRKPVAEGLAFCDSCGLRVSPPPACAKCHLPLAPETNFCEVCGTPVDMAPEDFSDPGTEGGKSSTEIKKGRSTKSRRGKKKAPKKDEFVHPSMLIPETAIAKKTLVNPLPEPDERDSVVLEPVPAHSHIASANPSPPVPSGSRKTLLVAGLVGLVFILAVAFLTSGIHAPSFSVPTEAASTGVQSIPTGNTKSSSVQVPLAEETTTKPPLVPGTTQVPPESLQIWIRAERDPVTNIVSILFDGGKGQRGVRAITVTLIRSDGQVLSRTFKPLIVGEGVSLQGTKYTDRLEVNVSYNNGDEYRVIDKIFEYKQRN